MQDVVALGEHDRTIHDPRNAHAPPHGVIQEATLNGNILARKRSPDVLSPGLASRIQNSELRLSE